MTEIFDNEQDSTDKQDRSVRKASPFPPRRHKHKRKSRKKRSMEELRNSDGELVEEIPFWKTLGDIRIPDTGIAFEWKEQIKFCPRMGRAYYDGFQLNGENYSVGTVVEITEGDKPELFQIASTFQATHSFEGFCNRGDKSSDELQRRGECPSRTELSRAESRNGCTRRDSFRCFAMPVARCPTY